MENDQWPVFQRPMLYVSDDVDTELYRLLGAKAAQLKPAVPVATSATRSKKANGNLSGAVSMGNL